MVSLPPVNPKAPSHVEPEAVDTQKRPGKTPEAVRLMLSCWAVMIAGELLHQILVVVSTALDPAALREAALETAKSRGGEVMVVGGPTLVCASVVVDAVAASAATRVRRCNLMRSA